MVPIGKKAFFPGELVHTNELMVLLGDNYFAERSAVQAAGIVDRRMAAIDEKVLASQKQMFDLRARQHFNQELNQHNDGSISVGGGGGGGGGGGNAVPGGAAPTQKDFTVGVHSLGDGTFNIVEKYESTDDDDVTDDEDGARPLKAAPVPVAGASRRLPAATAAAAVADDASTGASVAVPSTDFTVGVHPLGDGTFKIVEKYESTDDEEGQQYGTGAPSSATTTNGTTLAPPQPSLGPASASSSASGSAASSSNALCTLEELATRNAMRPAAATATATAAASSKAAAEKGKPSPSSRRLDQTASGPNLAVAMQPMKTVAAVAASGAAPLSAAATAATPGKVFAPERWRHMMSNDGEPSDMSSSDESESENDGASGGGGGGGGAPVVLKPGQTMVPGAAAAAYGAVATRSPLPSPAPAVEAVQSTCCNDLSCSTSVAPSAVKGTKAPAKPPPKKRSSKPVMTSEQKRDMMAKLDALEREEEENGEMDRHFREEGEESDDEVAGAGAGGVGGAADNREERDKEGMDWIAMLHKAAHSVAASEAEKLKKGKEGKGGRSNGGGDGATHSAAKLPAKATLTPRSAATEGNTNSQPRTQIRFKHTPSAKPAAPPQAGGDDARAPALSPADIYTRYGLSKAEGDAAVAAAEPAVVSLGGDGAIPQKKKKKAVHFTPNTKAGAAARTAPKASPKGAGGGRAASVPFSGVVMERKRSTGAAAPPKSSGAMEQDLLRGELQSGLASSYLRGPPPGSGGSGGAAVDPDEEAVIKPKLSLFQQRRLGLL